jgi:hypothetical protein
MQNKKSRKWQSGGWWLRSIYLVLLCCIAGVTVYAMTQRADAPDFPGSTDAAEAAANK